MAGRVRRHYRGPRALRESYAAHQGDHQRAWLMGVSEMTGAVNFKIGLVGPTRIGKTSLITALLGESHTLLAGSGVAMRTVGMATDAKVASNKKELDGDLLAGEFQSKSLKGPVEPFTFHLKLDPGVPESQINIDLLDFPGGW